MREPPLCFVIMPFRPELNYFYLYLQRHLQERFRLRVERGDSDVMTKALLEKLRDRIAKASFLIGDITGGSPNVFFELGIAHAVDKPIVFLTQDPPAAAPVDVRHFDFLQYDLARHEEFLVRLDNAVVNLLGAPYDVLLERARSLLRDFNRDNRSVHEGISREAFVGKMLRADADGAIPPAEQEDNFSTFLLIRILQTEDVLLVAERITSWVKSKYSR
jgi:hypothetical protein